MRRFDSSRGHPDTSNHAERAWLARRVPDLRLLDAEPAKQRTVGEVAAAWYASRIDVAGTTRTRNDVEIKRIVRELGSRPADLLDAHEVAVMVVALTDGCKPSTIRKTVQTLAMILDHAGVTPNPARDKTIVKLPRGEDEEINPPTAAHVAAVFVRIAEVHRLPLLWLDWSGARVASVDLTLVGDYDEPRRRLRLRAATTKTKRALWVDLHPALADAIEASLPHRRFRDPQARLFDGSGADALRTAIGKACKAEGIPTFSPHDLRHWRISLLHLRGVPWARIWEFVGQRSLSVTADIYSHVLSDETEIDYAALLAG